MDDTLGNDIEGMGMMWVLHLHVGSTLSTISPKPAGSSGMGSNFGDALTGLEIRGRGRAIPLTQRGENVVGETWGIYGEWFPRGFAIPVQMEEFARMCLYRDPTGLTEEVLEESFKLDSTLKNNETLAEVLHATPPECDVMPGTEKFWKINPSAQYDTKRCISWCCFDETTWQNMLSLHLPFDYGQKLLTFEEFHQEIPPLWDDCMRILLDENAGLTHRKEEVEPPESARMLLWFTQYLGEAKADEKIRNMLALFRSEVEPIFSYVGLNTVFGLAVQRARRDLVSEDRIEQFLRDVAETLFVEHFLMGTGLFQWKPSNRIPRWFPETVRGLRDCLSIIQGAYDREVTGALERHADLIQKRLQ